MAILSLLSVRWLANNYVNQDIKEYKLMSKPPKIKPEQEVNAYLFYAQRLLNLFNSSTLIQHQADKMALTSAICLSLKQTWQAWLKELSVYVGKDLADSHLLFSTEFNQHPEIQLLMDIKKQPANWLSSLMIFFEPRLNTPTVLDEGESDVQNVNVAARIELVQVAQEDVSELDQLNKVISDFKTYIQSVRSRQAEW